jgi:hypothetical protein
MRGYTGQKGYTSPKPIKVKSMTREVLNSIHDAIKTAKHANDSATTVEVSDLLVALVPVLKDANPNFDVERFAVGLTDVATINRLVALNVIAPALTGVFNDG